MTNFLFHNRTSSVNSVDQKQIWDHVNAAKSLKFIAILYGKVILMNDGKSFQRKLESISFSNTWLIVFHFEHFSIYSSRRCSTSELIVSKYHIHLKKKKKSLTCLSTSQIFLFKHYVILFALEATKWNASPSTTEDVLVRSQTMEQLRN